MADCKMTVIVFGKVHIEGLCSDFITVEFSISGALAFIDDNNLYVVT
jgi:hypothetical protein